MAIELNARLQGVDGTYRKVVAINGDHIVVQSGLMQVESVVTRADLEAWQAPAPPAAPSPQDPDDAPTGITVTIVSVGGVPLVVSPRQLRLALFNAGLLDRIDTFVASSAVSELARISWEYATEYRRDNPLLNQMAQLLDPPMSSDEIDTLFTAAAAIE